MGRYYGVCALVKRGKKIGDTFTEQQPRIQDDEALIGILGNGDYLIAVDLSSKSEYEVFRKAYEGGRYLAILLYKIKRSDLVNCLDEGRVDTRKFKHSRDFYGQLLGIPLQTRKELRKRTSMFRRILEKLNFF
jgi:hypothetical protein